MSKTEEKTIQLPYSLSVRELAGLLSTSAVTVIKILMSNGVMASINQQIDFDTAAVVATELGYEPQLEQEEVVVRDTLDAQPAQLELLLQFGRRIAALMGVDLVVVAPQPHKGRHSHDQLAAGLEHARAFFENA